MYLNSFGRLGTRTVNKIIALAQASEFGSLAQVKKYASAYNVVVRMSVPTIYADGIKTNQGLMMFFVDFLMRGRNLLISQKPSKKEVIMYIMAKIILLYHYLNTVRFVCI